MSVDGPRKSRGRPPVDSEAVKARIAQPVLGALDTWITDQPEPRPGRSDVIRVALADYLSAKGYLPAAGENSP